MLTTYLIISFIIGLMLFIIWTNEGINFVIKLFFLFSMSWSIYELLIVLGKIDNFTYLNKFIWINSILYGLMGIAWSKKNMTNLFIKILIIIFSIFGLIVNI